MNQPMLIGFAIDIFVVVNCSKSVCYYHIIITSNFPLIKLRQLENMSLTNYWGRQTVSATVARKRSNR
jgi:hypothetical protein